MYIHNLRQKRSLGPVHMGEIPVSEKTKTFRQAKQFCSVHREKRYPAYRTG